MYLQPYLRQWAQSIGGHELDLARSHDVIDRMTIQLKIGLCYFLLCPTGTEPLSSTVFKIFASKYIWVTNLTFQGHVTSPVTWPFHTPDAIADIRCSK